MAPSQIDRASRAMGRANIVAIRIVSPKSEAGSGPVSRTASSRWQEVLQRPASE